MPIPKNINLEDARKTQAMVEATQLLRMIAQSLQQISATLQRMELKPRR